MHDDKVRQQHIEERREVRASQTQSLRRKRHNPEENICDLNIQSGVGDEYSDGYLRPRVIANKDKMTEKENRGPIYDAPAYDGFSKSVSYDILIFAENVQNQTNGNNERSTPFVTDEETDDIVICDDNITGNYNFVFIIFIGLLVFLGFLHVCRKRQRRILVTQIQNQERQADNVRQQQIEERSEGVYDEIDESAMSKTVTLSTVRPSLHNPYIDVTYSPCKTMDIKGDLNKNCMSNLPSNIRDAFFINGLTNIIDKATHFDTRTGSSSLLGPILVTDSIPVLDKDTIPIDRGISDHNGTYVTIDCGLNDASKDLPEFEDRCFDFLSQIIVSEQCVLDIVSTLDANKAVGPDIVNVSNRMLFAVRNEISKPLC
ncbi:unnamed protein product [Mytilus coruscus]|uniref:Uncharacterized protein n=1 Tax=Mytilus coruscus TaxID=42192 RepID=A0A6J8DNR2_MYTCO|nr:unnamed protein product [Mytilus coruscus]